MKDNLKYIGENIRSIRRSKNLTIDSLSEIVDISPSFLGTIERGESSLSVETLINICKALNVSSDYIILENNPIPSTVNCDKKDTISTLLNGSTDKELDFLIEYIKLYRSNVTFKDA